MPNASAQNGRLETMGFAAAGIAHDINNQLTLIVNHLSMQNPDGALEAVDRCAALAQSLLDCARGETVALRPLDPVAFLRRFLARQVLPKGVRLVTQMVPALPLILADPLSLDRALTNLIANACAAMGNEGILLVFAGPQRIEIADSGPGVSPDQQQRIFEPFFTTKGKQGTGLGLSIVRDVMRQHGGSATVHSEPGHGARFTLQFRTPRKTSPAGPQGITGLSASPRKIAPAA
jgi:signal transduction histidine kinase